MDLISARDLKKEVVEHILNKASLFSSGKSIPDHSGKVLATLFFEPSTRTKLSFQSAACRLGMKYIDFIPDLSSLKKGESFSDTIRVVKGYCDVMVVRHPKEGSARLASLLSEKPVINGGDGGNQHPTQALIDLYTIKKLKGKLNINIWLVGDLKHARTMQSLVHLLSLFGAKITLASPRGLEMDHSLVSELSEKTDASITETYSLDLEDADVVYVCRIQKERFSDPYEARRVEEKFRIREELIRNAGDDLAILHPLPKVSEIDPKVDSMPNARYFEQAHNGVPVRMAILDYVLGEHYA